jgi:hypothetical protein
MAFTAREILVAGGYKTPFPNKIRKDMFQIAVH